MLIFNLQNEVFYSAKSSFNFNTFRRLGTIPFVTSQRAIFPDLLKPKPWRSKTLQPHLCKQQPAESAAGRSSQLEVVFGRHPRLHGLQLAGGQVSGVMTDQVALELVGLEVEMHRHRVAHWEVPGHKPRYIGGWGVGWGYGLFLLFIQK